VLSAVMFGALSGAGALPWPREACEAVIRESGRGAQASLAGFDDAWRQADASGTTQPASSEADTLRPMPDALRTLQMADLPEGPRGDWTRAVGGLPLPMQASAAHGALRCRDFQDDAYAASYLSRLARLAAAAVPAGTGSTTADALDEAARHLALWMCFEDVIRVADLKSRASRLRRVREEAQAADADVVRVVDYMKPGLEEVAAILPRRAGEWLARQGGAAAWAARWQPGLQIRSSSLWGHLLLRVLARMRPWRRASLRFAQEDEAIEAWLGALRQMLAASPAFALQLAGLPQVLKGYGDTQRRGRHNYARLWTAHVAPVLASGLAPDGSAPDLEAAAGHLRQGLAAALADPEGRLNETPAAASPVDPPARPIQWMRRPGGHA
jgi:indolepyruvate ferredoxin oxidoreductase beta subunit